MEEWRAIVGFPGYEVSNAGRVKGQRGELKLREDRKGYLFAVLSRDGTQAKRGVARLVAEAFVGPRPAGQVVRHRDGVKSRNVPDNLVYGTQVENEADKRLHGTAPIGVQHPAAKLTEEQVRQVRARYVRMSQTSGGTALAREFGVSAHLISMIVRGKLWSHLS